MSEQNRALMHRWAEMWNQGDPAVADEIFAAEWVGHTPGADDQRGVEAVKQRINELRGGFPDLHITIQGLIAERDMVVARIGFTGTHRGEFQRITATGRRVDDWGITIRRIRNGKMVEGWTVSNPAVMMRQLGHSG
jgi:predicted ester cyclase